MKHKLKLTGSIFCKKCHKKLLIKKFRQMKTDERFLLRKCPKCKKINLLSKRELK